MYTFSHRLGYIVVVKQDVTKMSVEALAAHVEAVRAKNRARSKRYYDNQIKRNPGKYQKFLEKCNNNNKTYYHSKDTNIIMYMYIFKNKNFFLIYIYIYIYIYMYIYIYILNIHLNI
jgi:hypothetical protein